MHYLRDDVFNRLIVWLMKHCHCYATVLYTAFTRYSPKEIEIMYKSWKEYNGLE